MAGRGKVKGAFRDQFPSPKQSLAEGEYKDENNSLFCFRNGKERLLNVFRHKVWIPTLLRPPANAGLFYIPLRKTRYFRCIALRFGWGRSPLCFTKFLRPLVQHLRSPLAYMGFRYIDYFLISHCLAGRAATERDALSARKRLSHLLNELGLVQK